MAHMIQQVNGRGQMAWRVIAPWHQKETNSAQVGDKYDSLPFAEQVKAWMRDAQIDFRVQRRAIAMRNAEGQELLTAPLAGYRAIVRADTNEVFQIATTRYNPMQTEDMLGIFGRWAEAGAVRIETVGGINGGRKIWALAKIGKDGQFDIGADAAQGYVLLATSHDGSLRNIAMPTAVYVVCQNTLSAAVSGSNKFAWKHSKRFTPDVAENARAAIEGFVESLAETTERARALSHVSIDDAGRIEFLKRLLNNGETLLEQVVSDAATPTADLNAIAETTANRASTDPTGDLKRLGRSILEAMLASPGSDLPERKDTLWGAVQGVTYVVDHERGRSADTRLDSSWFGAGAALKARALTTALDIAGTR